MSSSKVITFAIGLIGTRSTPIIRLDGHRLGGYLKPTPRGCTKVNEHTTFLQKMVLSVQLDEFEGRACSVPCLLGQVVKLVLTPLANLCLLPHCASRRVDHLSSTCRWVQDPELELNYHTTWQVTWLTLAQQPIPDQRLGLTVHAWCYRTRAIS